MNLFLAKHMGRYLVAGTVTSFSKIKREDGQGALEYIAIVIGLVVIIALLFYFFGHAISVAGCNAIHSVTGNTESCSQQSAKPSYSD